MAILRHVSKHDENLQSHLYKTELNSRIKYTSPDIKIIKISGEMVGERACNHFEYDEATGVSTQEQASVCVRFVECTGGKVILCEELLGSVSASETIGENLAELF
jgi:hypothetical protein